VKRVAALAAITGFAIGCSGVGAKPALAPDHAAVALAKCQAQADALQVSTDVCEGLGTDLTRAEWDAKNVADGWQPQPADAVIGEFGHPGDCWGWLDDTTVYVCWSGEVTTS
jgi:hypothetical protein